MARVGETGFPCNSRLEGSTAWSRWRPFALATTLALACILTAGPLTADEFPGSITVSSVSPLWETPARITVPTPFALDAQQPSFWSATPGLEPQFVAIDDPTPAAVFRVPFAQSQTIGDSSRGFWAAVGRWESRLWRPERPTIVLTSDQTSSVSLDQVPLVPSSSDEAHVASGASGLAPDSVGSPLQPIDGCPCPPISFRDDAWAFIPRVGHDAWGVVNNWDNLIILGTALGGSLALRGDVDQDVRNWTGEHPDRWGEGSKIIGDFGVVQYQIPVIFAAYAFTVWHQDEYEHQMMTSLISAYTIFGLSTLTIKGIADTKRPSDTWNGGNFGFPSWHDGSLFCMAAVIDDYEGHWIGVPLYILSGLVGWSRIDTRDHDLSDVVFGGVLGYVIGKSVAGRALYGDSRAVHIVPFVHPTEGTAGVMFDATF
jgi:membrane-associated phospholipid phosphatase